MLRLRAELLVCLALALASVAAYGGLASADFIDFDDDLYVTGNAQVRRGVSSEGIRWALTTHHASNWHPLTWSSHMLDVELWGLDPIPHHLTNLAFHVANTLLLFALGVWTTGARWRSAFVAGLFALHPLHVESVAWISERKDVLAAFLWLAATLAYVRYARSGRAADYALSFALLTLGLAAKPMLVTLPFAFLLLDFWPLGRTRFAEPAHSAVGYAGEARPALPLKRLVVEKLPFLIPVAASIALTLAAQQEGGALKELTAYPLELRAANALVAYAAYIGKTFWPVDLALLYPHPLDWSLRTVAGAGALLLAISASALALARTRPYLLVGWLWYLGTLVPVIGIVQVGAQWMADRYTYIPLIGLFVVVAWGVPDLLARWRVPMRALAIGALAVLAASGVATAQQVARWRNTETVFEHALEVTSDNFVAHHVLGLLRTREGRIEDAKAHYEEALRIAPLYCAAHYNLGRLLVEQEHYSEALFHLGECRRLLPGHAKTHFYLGLIMERTGNDARAVHFYAEGLEREPRDAQARTRLGAALARLDRQEEAAAELRRALEIDPSALTPLRYLTQLLISGDEPDPRDPEEAVQLAEQACQRTEFRDLPALELLESVYAAVGRPADAARIADRTALLARELGEPAIVDEARARARQHRSQPVEP